MPQDQPKPTSQGEFRKYSYRGLFGRRFRWRFVHRNGHNMANGSEGYNTRQKRDASLESFIRIVGEGRYDVVDVDAAD